MFHCKFKDGLGINALKKAFLKKTTVLVNRFGILVSLPVPTLAELSLPDRWPRNTFMVQFDYCKMHGQLVFGVFGSFFPVKCGVVRQSQTSPVWSHLVEVDIWSFVPSSQSCCEFNVAC